MKMVRRCQPQPRLESIRSLCYVEEVFDNSSTAPAQTAVVSTINLMVFCRRNEAKRQAMHPKRHTTTPKLRRISDIPLSHQQTIQPQICPAPRTPTTSSKRRILPPSIPPIPQTNQCRSHSVTETRRRALKSKNKKGNPIRLPSKVLALIADPQDAGAVYVAESGGTARRLVLDVGEASSTRTRVISTV